MDWRELQELADEAARSGDAQKAVKLYTATIEKTGLPEDLKKILYSKRCASFLVIYLRKEEGGREGLSQAIRDAAKCIEIAPHWAQGHVCMAKVWIATKQMSKAVAALDNGIALDSSNQELLKLRAALNPPTPQAQTDIDESLSDGLMSGTFRWSKTKRLFDMPDYPVGSVELVKGWGSYLSSRDTTGKMVDFAKKDSSLLDCLTFPITIAFWLHELALLQCQDASTCKCKEGTITQRACFNIVVLGATTKAEERVLRNTRAFHELAHLFPSQTIRLWLVGPEMSDPPVIHGSAVQQLGEKLSLPRNMEVRLTRLDPPCVKPLLAHEEYGLNAHNTAFVTFNGGFGNFVDSGDTRLLWSWLPDLCEIADSGIPALFTCANDYADVQGEVLVQSYLVGARFVTCPTVNPYHAGSTFRGVNNTKTPNGSPAWFCANHSVYVIQGADAARRTTVRAGASSTEREKVLEEALKGKREMDIDQHMKAVDVGGGIGQKGNKDSKDDAATDSKQGVGTHSARDQPGGQTKEGGGGQGEQSEAGSGRSAEAVGMGTKAAAAHHDIIIVDERGVKGYRFTASLPLLESLDQANLEVSSTMLKLQTPSDSYVTQISWPSPVDADACKAKFARKTKQLSVFAPLIAEK